MTVIEARNAWCKANAGVKELKARADFFRDMAAVILLKYSKDGLEETCKQLAEKLGEAAEICERQLEDEEHKALALVHHIRRNRHVTAFIDNKGRRLCEGDTVNCKVTFPHTTDEQIYTVAWGNYSFDEPQIPAHEVLVDNYGNEASMSSYEEFSTVETF